MKEDDISYAVRGVAFETYKEMGPGLYESVYEISMMKILQDKCFEVRHLVPLPVVFRDVKMEAGFRIDLEVNKLVLVEIKSVEALHDVHFKQVLTNLKLSGRRLGLLINFNESPLKIVRLVNGL